MNENQAKEVLELFHKTGRMLHSRELFGDVPKSEFFILGALYDLEVNADPDCFQGVPVTQLAKELNMSKAAMSKLLRIVEQKNHITRVLCDEDRRVVYIRLSMAGKLLLLDSMAQTEEAVGGLLESLGETDTRELTRILRKLLHAAEANALFYKQKARKEITQR